MLTIVINDIVVNNFPPDENGSSSYYLSLTRIHIRSNKQLLPTNV